MSKSSVFTPRSARPNSSRKAEARALALEEYKLLQTIIAEHEKHAFTVKAFLVLILSGLASLLFSIKYDLAPWLYFLLGVGATAVCTWWAVEHKALARIAIKRTRDIERETKLSGSNGYLGLGISNSFANADSEANSKTWTRCLRTKAELLLRKFMSDRKVYAFLHPTNLVPLSAAACFVVILTVASCQSQFKPTKFAAATFALNMLGTTEFSLLDARQEGEFYVVTATGKGMKCEIRMLEDKNAQGSERFTREKPNCASILPVVSEPSAELSQVSVYLPPMVVNVERQEPSKAGPPPCRSKRGKFTRR